MNDNEQNAGEGQGNSASAENAGEGEDVKATAKVKKQKAGKTTEVDNADNSASAENAGEGKYVLLKNHGMLVNGRAHQFYEAGTEFDVVADAKLIAALINSGAKIEQQ